MVIPEPQAGLGEGLLLGVKQALGDELEDAFRTAGIIHIVVLSGYNIMLVVAFVMQLLSLFLKPKWRLLVGLIVIVGFAVMVGLSATVVRASLMAALLLIAGTIGRTYQIVRALFFAGAVMIAFNPYLLLYDIGFQFSFMATLGLILVTPAFKLVSKKELFISKVREYALATLATQIMVLPLLLYYMGEVSLIAVAVNVIVLPAVPLAMLGTFLSGLIALVSIPLALPTAFITNIILGFIVTVALWSAALPFAALSVPVFPVAGVFILYGILAAVLWRRYFLVEEKNECSDWLVEEEKETGTTEGVVPVSEPPVFFR